MCPPFARLPRRRGSGHSRRRRASRYCSAHRSRGYGPDRRPADSESWRPGGRPARKGPFAVAGTQEDDRVPPALGVGRKLAPARVPMGWYSSWPRAKIVRPSSTRSRRSGRDRCSFRACPNAVREDARQSRFRASRLGPRKARFCSCVAKAMDWQSSSRTARRGASGMSFRLGRIDPASRGRRGPFPPAPVISRCGWRSAEACPNR